MENCVIGLSNRSSFWFEIWKYHSPHLQTFDEQLLTYLEEIWCIDGNIGMRFNQKPNSLTLARLQSVSRKTVAVAPNGFGNQKLTKTLPQCRLIVKSVWIRTEWGDTIVLCAGNRASTLGLDRALIR